MRMQRGMQASTRHRGVLIPEFRAASGRLPVIRKLASTILTAVREGADPSHGLSGRVVSRRGLHERHELGAAETGRLQGELDSKTSRPVDPEAPATRVGKRHVL